MYYWGVNKMVGKLFHVPASMELTLDRVTRPTNDPLQGIPPRELTAGSGRHAKRLPDHQRSLVVPFRPHEQSELPQTPRELLWNLRMLS